MTSREPRPPTSSAELIALAERVMLRNYRQQPVVFERGRGVELFDVDGTRYLDMTSGIAVSCLGHGHPALTRAIAEQAALVLHTSNLYYNRPQILAAEAITRRCFADRVFFCNSGGEANEAALKLARRYQHVVAGSPQRNTLVATHGSFHGRTFATLSITGQEKYRANFGPLVDPVTLVPFGDVAAAAAVLRQRLAACFVVEPIQAEGGIIVAPPGYLAALRELCDETETLLVFDEVQTGIGRTGKWFGYEWDGVAPDVMTLAKGLGGGVPIGALAVSQKAAQGLTYVEGDAVPHASTFGGNALACAAALAVLDTIERDDVLAGALRSGQRLAELLGDLCRRYPAVCVETRGRGLLQGLAVRSGATALIAACRERGLLLSLAGGNVLRFAPPLVVGTAHVEEAVHLLADVLRDRAEGRDA